MAASHSVLRSTAASQRGDLVRWLVAYTASVIGDGIFFLALSWTTSQTASAAHVGLVVAIGTIPRAVLMLAGGVVADRFGPRRIVIASDAVRCAVLLAATGALLLSAPGLGILIAVALVFGVVDALFMPAVGALPPLLVAPESLARVQGMRMLAIRIGNTTGPPLAGFALALGGPAAAFAAAGGLFAVSVPLLISLKGGRTNPAGAAGVDEPTRAGAWRDLLGGLRYCGRRRLIRTLLAAAVLVELGSMPPLNIGIVVLSHERGWGASGVGWIIGAFGVGAGASALLLTVVGRLPRVGVVVPASLLAGSAGIAALSVTPSLLAAAAISAATGLMFGLNGALVNALVQVATEAAFLGRVMSLLSLISFGITPLAYPAFGMAVTLAGTRPAFLACAALGCAGALACFGSAAVRRAQLPG